MKRKNLIKAEIKFLEILLDIEDISKSIVTKNNDYLNYNNKVVFTINKNDKIVWFDHFYIIHNEIFDLINNQNNIQNSEDVKIFLSQMIAKHLGFKNYKISF